MTIIQDICRTPLHYASLRCHIDAITELLRFGADLDAQDKSGCTPLHLAALCGHNLACDLLVSAGASVLSRDHENLSPIHCAIRKGYHRIVDVMMKQSVSYDILLQDGGNLLAYASRFGNAEMIEILIAAGMNINLTDSDEWPAFLSAMLNQALTEEFRIKLLTDVDNLYQTPRSESLLAILCLSSLLLATRGCDIILIVVAIISGNTTRTLTWHRLLRRVPKDKVYQYVNYISIYGTALYRTAAKSREQNLTIAELPVGHGAELEIIKWSHGTPLMGARITCNKRDGTQMTAVEEARYHPDIVSLLKSFDEKGVEALNEPRPALLANMVKVEECMNRIVEDEEQGKYQEKDEKRHEKEKKKEECEKICEDEGRENDIFEKDKE
ncbi:hypothetical protein BCON_0350g00110 [Botryotinia convoluta]|uniref:Uncharacterized protein n=1 Tax=Botryotinia convoluta TaxID=54673 RepID=A0A4Z1HAW8_9HELO|nr:hypothetical protein BCON_0350g00110 [Botryotinia convoluta]